MGTSKKHATRNLIVAVVVVLCAGGGIAVAAINDGGPGPDPDANLSAAERDAKYQSLQAGYDVRYAAWLQSDAARSLDLSTLKHEATMAVYPPGAENLDDAVDAADIAVEGTVTKTTFIPYGTITEFTVNQVPKGDVTGTIMVLQQGSALYAHGKNFEEPYIGDGDAQPLLIEGDQAVLLLDPATPQAQAMVSEASARYGAQSITSATPLYTIQPYSGQYKVEQGKVKTVKGSKVKDVEGKSKKELVDRIAAHHKANKGKKKLVIDPSQRQGPPDS